MSQRLHSILTRLGLGALWTVAHLPYPVAMAAGAAGGRLYHSLSRQRRRVAAINIDLCFPRETPAFRERLVRDHFVSLGQGIVEMGIGWWTRLGRLERRTRVEGLEHLERAAAAGRGVILYSAHFTSLELGGCLLSLYKPFAVVYRRHGNPVLQRTLERSRSRLFVRAIPKDNIKQMLRSLKAGEVVWFATDQHPSRKSAVYADFFGITTLTSTSTARIARLSGAPVVPFFPHRDGAGGYRLKIMPAVQGFPSGDDAADAALLNALVEKEVYTAPEEYLWIHRRFKTTGSPQGNPYP